MPLLFCYGSNHPAQLEDRIGPAKSLSPAFTPGYKRVFRGWSRRWGGGVASLVAGKTRPAHGYVAQVTEGQLDLMDQYEGVAVGAYVRRTIKVVKVSLKTGKTSEADAVAYVSTSKEFNPPSREYLRAVLKTIQSFWGVDDEEDIVVE